VNDNGMVWRDPVREEPLRPPAFGLGCRVGSGAVILAGVVIGDHALVGAGSVVTRSVLPHCVVYGVPARHHGTVTR
jgi:acetyltransferase-like isoleucine patch superfamily enzyme